MRVVHVVLPFWVLSMACAADRQLGSSDSAAAQHDLAADDDTTTTDAASESEASTAGGSGPRPGPDSAYPYCEWNAGDFAPYCPSTVGGHGFLNWHVDGDVSTYCDTTDCNACICYASCNGPGSEPDDPSRCPIPDSGTARPECIDPASTCYLTCDDGESCPDGMSCVDSNEIQRHVCAWVRD